MLREFGWRRILAFFVWALCVLGSFLPTSSSVFVFGFISITSFSPVSTSMRLVGISIPLAMVFVGTWLSDDDENPFKRVFGILLEIAAWVAFARLIGLFVLGPLVLML